jgi:DNA-binding MarR family transcriptional regulator
MPTLLGAYALLAFSILLPMFGHHREALATERPAASSEDAAVTEVVRRVLAALEKPAESNDELAGRLGVPKGTASKWASAAEDAGAIQRHRDGRKVRLVRVA